MRKFIISSKVKGIFGVSASNLLSLALSMITSFLLPLFISVEEYGYWQLFVLYNSYIGFFILGFNDGVHLNYAAFDYDSQLAKKFAGFKRFLSIMTVIESLLLLTFYLVFFKNDSKDFYVVLLVIFNLIPTGLNGLFTYMNQATMRFRYYAISTIIDKILFVLIMIVLIVFGMKNSIYYIAAFTATRYCVIIYHYFTSKEVFTATPTALKELRPEIVANFRDGFALMIAVILGNSIIVGSRLLVKAKYGIETFGAFSFSIHTIVIASQFITAIASVFYPILKRCKANELKNAYVTLDKSSSLLSILLLLSYYPVALIVLFVYTKYNSILSYLMFVYPLFIFQCKSSLLITNVYKVRNKIFSLILANSAAIVIHLLLVFLAYNLFHSVTAIAIAVLMAYGLWYYIFQNHIFRKEGWSDNIAFPVDALMIVLFIFVNISVSFLSFEKQWMVILIQMAVFSVVIALIGLVTKNKVHSILRETYLLLKD